jgi:hypothetical protein
MRTSLAAERLRRFWAVALVMGFGCAVVDPFADSSPSLGTNREALSDSCSSPCADGQMCCNGSCVSKAIGDYAPGLPLASLGTNGCLEYRRYANRATNSPSQDPGSINVIPDFSYAGYLGGGKVIPVAPVKLEVTAAGSNDRAVIQAAIDDIGNRSPDSQGVRGAVLLKRGVYEIDGELVIKKSGVVLRGEGQGSGGTILRSLKKSPYFDTNLIHVGDKDQDELVMGTTSALVAPGAGTSFAVAVGSRKVTVSTSNGTFANGQRVVVRRTPNIAWLEELGLKNVWEVGDLSREFERTVVIAGTSTGSKQTLTLDVPLVDGIESRYGGGEVTKVTINPNAVQYVGIERLRLDSLDFESATTFPTNEEHTYTAVKFENVRNSWVREVTALHFYGSAIHVHPGNFNTFQDVAMLDAVSRIKPTLRYSFHVQEGAGNLFQRCYSRNGRHAFVTNRKANGPNVWLDCAATQQHSDDGPHVQWATGLLFDGIETCQLHAENAPTSGSGQGWRGAQVMFWNSRTSTSRCGSNSTQNFSSEAPRAAMNWAVGTVGTRVAGSDVDEEDGIKVSEGTPVAVRSLYLQQLRDRLGNFAYETVTAPKQRSGRIGNDLREWEGEGDLYPDPGCDNGIESGNGACCALSCGVCGGDNCGDNPGARDGCCTGSILASGRSCLEYGPPCIMPTSDPKCVSGVRGTTDDGLVVCCDKACGTCGGEGCSERPGGANNCCASFIEADGESCLSNMPPCVFTDPQCTTGVASGSSCCPAICGRCGGAACGALPGGASECCHGEIQAAGRSCATNPPPCVMP